MAGPAFESRIKAMGVHAEASAAPSQWVDHHGHKRTVPMEVLVLGLPRTGTSSMVAALRKLGYGHIYHMTDCLINLPDCDIWNEAINAEFYGKGKQFGMEEWDQLLGRCMACTDFPVAAFGPSLAAAYPDAKIILTIRPFDAWYKSCENTILKVLSSRFFVLLSWIDPVIMGRLIPMIIAVWFGYFKTDRAEYFADPYASSKRAYDYHHEVVRGLSQGGKKPILEYTPGDGWEPLCKFLGKPVPEEEYPRINDAAAFQTQTNELVRNSLVLFGKKVVKVGIPIAVVLAGVILARRGVFEGLGNGLWR